MKRQKNPDVGGPEKNVFHNRLAGSCILYLELHQHAQLKSRRRRHRRRRRRCVVVVVCLWLCGLGLDLDKHTHTAHRGTKAVSHRQTQHKQFRRGSLFVGGSLHTQNSTAQQHSTHTHNTAQHRAQHSFKHTHNSTAQHTTDAYSTQC